MTIYQTSQSQCPMQRYCVHPKLTKRPWFLGLFRELVVNREEETPVCYFPTLLPLSLPLKAKGPPNLNSTACFWLIIFGQLLWTLQNECWKQVGERWKHPSTLGQPGLLDQAGRQQIPSTRKHVSDTEKEREGKLETPSISLAHISWKQIVQELRSGSCLIWQSIW